MPKKKYLSTWWLSELNLNNLRKAFTLLKSDLSGKALMAVLTQISQGQRNLHFDQGNLEYLQEEIKSIKPDLKILVTAHIHFPEYSQRFVMAAAELRKHVDCDFMVTSSSEEILRDVKQISQEQRVYVDTVHVPNRGRNIAPFVIEVGKRSSQYDLVIHVHSKRSSHTKRHVAEKWADTSWAMLLENTEVFRRMVAIMQNEPEIALAYPDTSDLLPPWAFSWLSNRRQAINWYKAQNMSFPEGRIAYPAGGMFAVKPAALRQIFQMNYSYEDFPEEKGQLDGELHHLIERLIGTLTSAERQSHLVYVASQNKFTKDLTFAKKGLNFTSGHNVLEVPIEFRTVSFDFFDTLYRRETQVVDAAKVIAAKAIFPEDDNAAQKFVETRNRVEYDLRVEKKFVGDVSLSEVHSRLEEKYLISAQKLINLEESAELGLAKPRLKYVTLINRCFAEGRTVFVVSDSFYSADFIRILASKIGVNPKIPIISSSDIGARKDNATIWPLLDQQFNLNRHSHLHVGDNEVSDIQIPNGLGYTVMQAPSPETCWTAAGNKLDPDLLKQNFSARAWHLGKIISSFSESF